MTRTDAQARALVAAGALLQGSGVAITPRGAERYTDAVQRVVDALEPSQRNALRAQVRWVLDYEAEGEG